MEDLVLMESLYETRDLEGLHKIVTFSVKKKKGKKSQTIKYSKGSTKQNVVCCQQH